MLCCRSYFMVILKNGDVSFYEDVKNSSSSKSFLEEVMDYLPM